MQYQLFIIRLLILMLQIMYCFKWLGVFLFSGALFSVQGIAANFEDRFPDWELRYHMDNVISSKQFDSDVSVILFWASWCHFCRNFLPHYAELAKTYGDTKVH